MVLAACGAGFGVWISEVPYWFYAAGEAAPAVLWVGAGTVVVAELAAAKTKAEVVDAPMFACCDGGAALFPADGVCVETMVPIGACGVVVAYGFAVWAVQTVVWELGILVASRLVACPFGTFLLEGMAICAPGLWEGVPGFAGGAVPDDG